MLLVHIDNDLVLALRHADRLIHFSWRGPRRLATRLLLRLTAILHALGSKCHSLGPVDRDLDIVIFSGALRVRHHKGLEVVRIAGLVREAIVTCEAQLTVGLLRCDFTLDGAASLKSAARVEVPRARIVQALFLNTGTAAILRQRIEH